jgi:hypothetical protein
MDTPQAMLSEAGTASRGRAPQFRAAIKRGQFALAQLSGLMPRGEVRRRLQDGFEFQPIARDH